ncbi:MAG TPA: cytochrome c peroxidase [Blastocatellia bacterium]|nr:cytochrome c peroxidase [Blastocatellia bacterium]
MANKTTVIKGGAALVLALWLGTLWPGWSQQQQVSSAQRQLGERLFRDARFSAPQGDLPASCASCHFFDEDPQGLRPFADFFNRSWISYRPQNPQRFELRNSPGLFDVAQQPRLHYDGEFGSLEELVTGTFTGRPMGWLPGEQEQALTQLQKVVLQDSGYRAQFKSAYGVALEKLNRTAVARHIARAVADFMRTLNSKMNAPYDEFVRLNGLATKPANGESAAIFAERFLARVNKLEEAKTLKLPNGFSTAALQGMKLFYSSGNCVTCHAPPLFTDFSYHNLGISQTEYDQVFGAGAFAKLELPNAAQAERPTERFRQFPTKGKPGEVDLGHWNFLDLKTSALRRASESDDQLLGRMIGAVKTPGLRHLAYTYPYMHNGAYTTLDDTVKELQRLSEMARAGQVRAADDELRKIQIREADVAPLVAFLQSLNEDLKRNYQQAKK